MLLKELSTAAPILTLLSEDEGYTMYREASRVGLKCVLIQNGKEIAYASH